jgi:two-component system response regulator PilR (NtrC family)
MSSAPKAQRYEVFTIAAREAAERVSLVGESSSHRQLLISLGRAAGTNVEVLFVGQTGVGQELYPRYLHECGARRKRPFVPVNCGALLNGLFENELFGHQAGAITGASRHSEGLVAAAEEGTLFLDEIDSLSPWSLVKLLRLLQDREFRRLGETRLRHADVRFVAATNSNLRDRVRADQFRENLNPRTPTTRRSRTRSAKNTQI